VFEPLKPFNRVFVTGPQRSGTRICARMIAHDTGHIFVDERDFHTDSLYHLSGLMARNLDENLVVHCPALCRWVHMLGAHDSVAVVLMRRETEDIIASQERIKWIWESVELMRYEVAEGNIAELKYWYWDKWQKDKIVNPFEIEYESLAYHPLWVEERKDWGAHQMEVMG